MELLLAVFIAAYAAKGIGADVSAAVAGKTPPSVLKWQERQKRRERPRRDPGYLGRIWDNALETWADSSTRRHQRRMQLRAAKETTKGPEWVAKKLEKAERAADRRQRFAEKRGVLWGKAAEAVTAGRKEKQAWEENARRDAEADPTVPAGLTGPAETEDDSSQGEDATVLPFRPRTDANDDRSDADTAGRGEEQSDTDAGETDVGESDVGESGHDTAGRSESDTSAGELQVYLNPVHHELTGPGLPCRWEGGPTGVAEGQCDQPRKPGYPMCPEHLARTDADAIREGRQTLSAFVEDYAAKADFQIEEFHAARDAAWRRQIAAVHRRDHEYPPAHGREDSTNTDNDDEGESLVTTPAHSGEITDLPSALDYVTNSSAYCDEITGVFETAHAQAAATATELGGQLSALETAESTLAGEGLTQQAGRLSSVAEQFTALTQAMRQVQTLLASTQDAIGAAKSELDTSAEAFRAQLGVAEAIQSQQEVADNTRFYANG